MIAGVPVPCRLHPLRPGKPDSPATRREISCWNYRIKRTARVVAENVLGMQGLYIAADEDAIVGFMLDVASYRLEPDGY